MRLPVLAPEEFAERLAPWAPAELPPGAVPALFGHYEELRRWAATVDLLGPGAADELFPRHYGESLAALPLLPSGPGRLVDLGSGAGFPGLVLAAARPDLEVTLVEARERRWAFLLAAVRKARLSAHCLRATVGAAPAPPLPRPIAVVTARALRITRSMVDALAPLLLPDARFLIWGGSAAPGPETGLRLLSEHPLPGSERRRIRVLGLGPDGGPAR